MKQKKTKWIILALTLLLLIAAGITAALLLKKPEKEEPQDKGMDFEASVILDDRNALQEKYNEMLKKAKEGYMTLSMKTVAFSSNGTDFSCYLGNAEENNYNCYLTISLDNEEELYRTDLIPVGGHIESFKSGKKLDPGTYSATVCFVQIEKDLKTVHAKVYAGLELVVKE